MVKTNIPPIEIYEKREQLGINNSISMLTEIIDIIKEDKIRQEAIIYLGKISNSSNTLKEQCFETLENLLISDDNVEIKCSAAKALGKTKYEKALKPLMWVIDQESTDNEVKKASLKAIANIRLDEPEIQLFIKELDNKNESIKDFIKSQLINVNPENIIKLLLNSLEIKSFSQKHITEIINLIGLELSSLNVASEGYNYLENKYPKLFSNLIQNKDVILESITAITLQDNTDLMNNTLTILRALGDEVLEYFIKILLKDDFLFKKNVIKLTGKLKLKDAVDFLYHNLDNIYNEISIATIEALGELGDLSAVPELLDVLNIDDISFEYLDLDVKFYILDAVKKIYLDNKNASYDYLYSYLNTGNDMIKESVSYILGEVANEEFVVPLIKVLKEKNLDVRKNTIIALGKIGDIKALYSLVKILEDNNTYWLIKKVVVDAIYNIYQKNWYMIKEDETESKRLLIKHTENLIHHLSVKNNEHFKVKLSIIHFLEDFGGKTSLNALIKRLNDFHRIVRIHASNAIKKIEKKLK